MTVFRLDSNLDETIRAFATAYTEIDPAIQSQVKPYGAETLDVEKHLAPHGKKHRDRGKTLAESIYLRTRGLGFQTITNKRYADIINRGGATGPHEILPKQKKALAFNGIVVKSVAHPGSHYHASRFAERTIAVMTPRIEKGWGDAVQKSIEGSLS